MNRKIGIIASDEELKSRVIELFESEVDSGNILIEVLDASLIDKQGKILEQKGAKAIIARSGSYRHTIGTVSIPVVHLKVTTPDILQAISVAKRTEKDIVLVISDLDYFDYDSWKDLISTNLILERFHSKDEIFDKVYKYYDLKDNVIIVGGGIPCALARNWGMDSVFINAGKESICEAVNHAREMVDNIYEQKFSNQVLKTVLDDINDAIVAVNEEGKVILYNQRAEDLLKKERLSIIGKDLMTSLPELSFITEVLSSKVDKNNIIKPLKNLTITANISVFTVDGKTEGALCSFQDISRLQSLEKKIRHELNKKGHVAKYNFEDIFAFGPIMKNVVEKAKKIGCTDNTVIIYGESGTGKEMMAQSIHNVSRRKKEPFVAINCAAITESLLESELFGYEEGAFTGARKGGKPGLFEMAHGGTIFLDEINSISLNLQGKLLRVLQERETMRIGSDYVIPLDIRIIAATNENLKTMVEQGRFRRDLFYRLNILELHIPPLRERPKDIIPLFNHFLREFSEDGFDVDIPKEIQQRFLSYEWPGNAREMKNIAQRYAIFSELQLDGNEILNNEKVNLEENSNTDFNCDTEQLDKIIDLKEINRVVEEKVIDMLSQNGLSKTDIAKMLGISRTALWKKMKN